MNGLLVVSLFRNEILPLMRPAVAAFSATEKVVVALGASVVAPKLETSVNPGGRLMGSCSVSGAVPTFLTVNVWILGTATGEEPTATAPVPWGIDWELTETSMAGVGGAARLTAPSKVRLAPSITRPRGDSHGKEKRTIMTSPCCKDIAEPTPGADDRGRSSSRAGARESQGQGLAAMVRSCTGSRNHQFGGEPKQHPSLS